MFKNKNVQICLHVFYLYMLFYILMQRVKMSLEKRRRSDCVIQEEGCTPTMTYPSDISDLPWEKNIQQCTIQM